MLQTQPTYTGHGENTSLDPELPSGPGSSKTPRLALIAGGIIISAVVIAAIMGLLARQSTRESARIAATLATLQKDLESVRTDLQALRADSDHTVVLSFTEPGYFPVRTNAGILLVALANVEKAGNGVRAYLRIGNPQSLTYRGFTLSLAWDQGKTRQTFADVLAPGVWASVSVVLSPADPTRTKSLTITSAAVDEILAR